MKHVFADNHAIAPLFREQPDFPTLWAVTQKSDTFKFPFGEILVINRNEG